MIILDMFTPLNVQKMYDTRLMEFRHDHLDTILKQFCGKLKRVHFLAQILPRMLAVEEVVRPSPGELFEMLPDRGILVQYYATVESPDQRVFSSVKPGQGINPKDSRKVMNGGMVATSKYQKTADDDGDVEQAATGRDELSQSRATSFHDAQSRRTREGAFETNFHECIRDEKRGEVSVLEVIRRPVREVHEKKHSWFQKEEGKLVYKDYIPPVYSVNRIIPSQNQVDQVAIDDEGVSYPVGMPESQKQKLRAHALVGILQNFNQNDIKKDMNDRFENYIMAGKEDSNLTFTTPTAANGAKPRPPMGTNPL